MQHTSPSVEQSSGRVIDRWLVGALVTLCVVASLLRVWRLGLQPYWVDETWSLQAAALSLLDSLHTIKFEVHPPTYQLMLWGWIRIGGVEPEWTRLLSALFGIAGVALACVLLRKTALPLILRLLWVAAVATSGMAIVYAQETRSYSLAWMVAVAITAMTVRVSLSRTPARSDVVLWAGAAAIGSAIHLFDALLALAGAIALALVWRSRWGVLAALAAAAMAPQLLWLGYGKLFVPGFAGGSSWIPAPGLSDLAETATTVFAFDGLHFTPRGFAWSSPVAVIVVVALLVVLGGWLFISRRSNRAASVLLGGSDAVLLATRTLGIMLASALVIAWVGSQFVHVWTVRNLIVLQPAAVWCAIAALYALAARLTLARVMSLLLVVLLTLNLVWIVANISHPYKPAHNVQIDCCGGITAS